MEPITSRVVGGLAVAFGIQTVIADPLDETQRNLFHLAPIGAWDDKAGSFNNAADYQARMLSLTGGVKPRNFKLGMSNGVDFLMSSHGAYYDYIYAPARVQDLGTHYLGEVDYSMDLAQRTDLPMGFHINGMPWADGQNQAEDHLHNFLERYQNGSLLQVDRVGRIRNSAVAQETSGTETFTDAPQLEMQVTLSRNATLVRDYAGRNCRAAMRILGAARDEHPDLVSFASLSSGVGQNLHCECRIQRLQRVVEAGVSRLVERSRELHGQGPVCQSRHVQRGVSRNKRISLRELGGRSTADHGELVRHFRHHPLVEEMAGFPDPSGPADGPITAGTIIVRAMLGSGAFSCRTMS